MKKQEKLTLSRKTKKNNTAIKAVLILTALFCLLSTIAHATEVTYNANQINRSVTFGYATLENEYLTNVTNNGYVINDGKGWNTNYRTTYTTEFAFLYIKYVPIKINSVEITLKAHCEFDDGTRIVPTISEYKNYKIGTGTTTRNPYRPIIQVSYQGTTTKSLKNLESNEVDSTNNIVNTENLKIYRDNSNINFWMYKDSFLEYNSNQIELRLPFRYISSILIIDDIEIKINDEVYEVVNKLENTINQIENGQEEAINAINPNGINGVLNDLQNNLDNTLTEIVKYNNNTLNSIFFANIFSGSAVIQIVMMISMTITIISYILFGKYK